MAAVPVCQQYRTCSPACGWSSPTSAATLSLHGLRARSNGRLVNRRLGLPSASIMPTALAVNGVPHARTDIDAA